MIKFENVTKRFGNRKILDEVSFEIKPGEFVSIVGDSGSGKSTIINLLLGEERPSFGHITVDGTYIETLKNNALQSYRQHVGAVFQDCKLLPKKTVYENVSFALEVRNYKAHEVIELTDAALKLIGIEHLKDNLPHQISGGEAQRVALARAIVYKPKLLLADEPTGHLDKTSAQEVIKNLLKINMRGTTVILTTHNKPLVEMAEQKILHLVEGKIS